MSEALRRVHEVERSDARPGHVDVALVRMTVREGRGLVRHHREVVGRSVLFHRTFRPMLELAKMESYAARLAAVARYADQGTFGCFVRTEPTGGTVEVSLYERWFDGDEIHTDELACRTFDPSDEAALVASTEFLADLRAWAERQNDEREAAYQRDSDSDQLRCSTMADQESASRDLADILAPHARPD